MSSLVYVALFVRGSFGMWLLYVAILVAWLLWSSGSSSIDSVELYVSAIESKYV